MDARVAVLASGEGTNLQALLDDAVVGPWIRLVVSEVADAPALARASARGIETLALDPVPAGAAFDDELVGALREREIGFVVLAGFMRVLGTAAVDAFGGRILNVHPSLLPAFPGAHAVADALAWGAKVTGVTVHLVDEEIDHGPIVAQEPVEIFPDDDWDSLERRIHAVEHRLLPAAARALVEGRVASEGRKVRIR